MTFRFVSEAALIERADRAISTAGSAAAAGRSNADAAADFRRWVVRQRTAPDLVGATAAAAILKVQPPHLARLRTQGRMPEAIPVEGSVDVYVREEVEALAEELERERRVRNRKRREREDA